MFGYIRTCAPQLRLCEMEAYRAVYCGLCRQLGKRFGPIARFTLSYDFTFLAMLGMALDEGRPDFERRACGVNPLRRCLHCEPNERLAQSCDIAVIALWYKLEDNLTDGGFFTRLGCRLARPFLRKAYRRAAADCPVLSEVFAAQTLRQQELEAGRCPDIDAACDPTAVMTAAMLASLSEEPAQHRILERMGYLLGRYIYMADALDDLEKDRASGNYNPFLQSDSPDEAKEQAMASLYLTIGELGATYELLELFHFQPVLDNIIHLGLKMTVDELRVPRDQRRKHKV